MPFVLALLRGLVTLAGPIAIRAAIALGFGALSYAGVKALLDQLFALVKTNVNALGADILVFVGVFNLDRYITILASAYLVRLLFMGMSATGVLSKMQWRGPTAGG